MTPGARISAAIEIATEIDDGAAASDSIVDVYFRHRRYAGSKDRRAVTERVYGLIRRHARLNWWIDRSGSTLPPNARLRAIADLALNDKSRPEEIAQLFSGGRHCPAELTPDEISLADSLAGRPVTHHSEMPDSVALEYPAWLDGSLKRAFGERLAEEMTALNQPAAMDLRVNTLKSTFEKVYDSLVRENFNPDPTPFSPLSIRINGHVRIGGSTAFQQGWIEVQDEGSQLISLLTDAREGMTVTDFCAGAGGKTLALAAAMARDGIVRGRLIACDVFSQRLLRMKSRIKRAGADGIQRRTLSSESDPWVTEQAETADRVLLDVPCTGTGTWRRHPVDKWRLTPIDLEDSIATQRRILESASGMVKPGGRLIYSTCSVLPEENEDQVGWFLSEIPGYEILDCRTLWQECVGGEPPTEGPHLHLSPASTRTDGFFCAVLQKG